MKRIGILTSLSFAFFGLFSTCSSGVSSYFSFKIGDNVSKSSQNKNESQIIKIRSESKLVENKVRTRGYSKSYYNFGIPPKTYGMHHVKRGTHKRTNFNK